MTLNDAMYTSLGTAGYTGALNDRLSQWLSSIGFDGPINEAWHAYLGSLGFAGTFPDRLKQWYTSLGGQGTVNDAARYCWVNNLTLGFAIVYEQTYQLRGGDPSGTKVGQYNDINANGAVVYTAEPGAVGLSVSVGGNVTTTSDAVYGEPLRTLSATGQDGGGTGDTSAVVAMSATTAAVPVNITTQPLPASIAHGEVASFSVTATGTAPITYQWQDDRGGSFADVTDGTGGTTSSYTTDVLLGSDTGRQYRCVLTNPAGSVNSDAAAVTVSTTPITAITFDPASPAIIANTAMWVCDLNAVGGHEPYTWSTTTTGYYTSQDPETQVWALFTTGRPAGSEAVSATVADAYSQLSDSVTVTAVASLDLVYTNAPNPQTFDISLITTPSFRMLATPGGEFELAASITGDGIYMPPQEVDSFSRDGATQLTWRGDENTTITLLPLTDVLSVESVPQNVGETENDKTMSASASGWYRFATSAPPVSLDIGGQIVSVPTAISRQQIGDKDGEYVVYEGVTPPGPSVRPNELDATARDLNTWVSQHATYTDLTYGQPGPAGRGNTALDVIANASGAAGWTQSARVANGQTITNPGAVRVIASMYAQMPGVGSAPFPDGGQWFMGTSVSLNRTGVDTRDLDATPLQRKHTSDEPPWSNVSYRVTDVGGGWWLIEWRADRDSGMTTLYPVWYNGLNYSTGTAVGVNSAMRICAPKVEYVATGADEWATRDAGDPEG